MPFFSYCAKATQIQSNSGKSYYVNSRTALRLYCMALTSCLGSSSNKFSFATPDLFLVYSACFAARVLFLVLWSPSHPFFVSGWRCLMQAVCRVTDSRQVPLADVYRRTRTALVAVSACVWAGRAGRPRWRSTAAR